MADKIVGQEVIPSNAGIPVRYKDMGDTTYALVVSASGGGGGGGGAVTVADGADVTLGTIADAAVAAGAAGTLNAHARATSRDVGTLATNLPAKGQAAMAASMPVAIASDQGPITVTGTVTTSAAADVFVAATNVTAQNLNPTSGTPTANSVVSVTLSGQNLVTANISANTLGANTTVQITYDGLNWVSLAAYAIVTASPQTITASATIATGATGQYQWQVGGAKGFRLAANSATVSGTLTASLNASNAASPLLTSVSLALVGGGAAPAVISQVGGGSTAALITGTAAATTAADYSAVAWAAASGSGATIADAAGAVVSYDVNLTAFTAGSSTGLDVFMDISKDAGTTWDTIWQFEALTAAGHASSPALTMGGARRRLRWVNRGGAATTATVTATANRISIAPAKVMRQFFDRTAGLITNPTVGATTTGWINGTATAGAGYETGGASTISAEISVGTATTPGTYQLQVCSFNSTSSADWVGVGTATLAVASSSIRLNATGITERFFRVICTVAGTSQTGNYIALTAS
jgi:hypothetical protein